MRIIPLNAPFADISKLRVQVPLLADSNQRIDNAFLRVLATSITAQPLFTRTGIHGSTLVQCDLNLIRLPERTPPFGYTSSCRITDLDAPWLTIKCFSRVFQLKSSAVCEGPRKRIRGDCTAVVMPPGSVPHMMRRKGRLGLMRQRAGPSVIKSLATKPTSRSRLRVIGSFLVSIS
jgi:hypothetical protein